MICGHNDLNGVYRMLTKPQQGWTDFCLGNGSYSLSYLTNIPLDWLDRAIFGLKSRLPFDVSGYCEPGSVVCTVSLCECHIVFRSDVARRNDVFREVLPVGKMDFCKMLHDDISEHIDDWVQWNPAYRTSREDIQSRLEQLKELLALNA